MKSGKQILSWLFVLLLSCWSMNAQQTPSLTGAATVPRLVNFSGKATDLQGRAISGIAGATFAIYKDQYEGSPLWLETQNIQADAKGNYTVQLGSTKPDGLPQDLFNSGEARWLGVTINGGQEQPRILLLSVPYALKAADAETIGGLPPSAFARAAGPASGNVTLVRAAPAQGTVTSVGLSAPASDFLVSGSPVRTKGTLGLNWNVAPTSSNTGNAIVKRDVNGNFWANYIGVSFIAAASTLGGSPVVSALDNNATGNGTEGVYGYSYGKIGVLGGCSGSQGCSGVYGDAPSLNGGFGFGVQGTSTLGPGIAGFNNSIGSVASSLLGTAPIGVIGDSNGYGVVATSDLSNALVAETGSSTTSDTVVINNLGGGFPLYAAGTGGSMYLDGAGNWHVSGQIFGSVKNFEFQIWLAKSEHHYQPGTIIFHDKDSDISDVSIIVYASAIC